MVTTKAVVISAADKSQKKNKSIQNNRKQLAQIWASIKGIFWKIKTKLNILQRRKTMKK